jgi:hypothetical protein
MTEPDAPAPPAHGTDWLLLGLLVVAVLPLRVWLVYNTEVTARDSIGYIRYALDFEKRPWDEILRRHDQHPGYSAAVELVSLPVRHVTGRTDAETMQLATQLTSTLAALLLLFPTYHLGRVLFNRPVGFWGALLFQCLPSSAHHLSDGISEPFFLLLVTSGLYQGVLAVQTRSVSRFAACGAIAGLAYLTRPEGLLVVASTGLVLLGMQAVPHRRLSWLRFAQAGLVMTCLTMALGAVYVSATGGITNKPVGRSLIWILQGLWDRAAGASQAEASGPPRALFAVTFQGSDQRMIRVGQSARALAVEVNHGLNYFGTVPAVLGLFWSLARLRRLPGFWVIAVYSLIHGAILVYVAMSAFYISERHTLILVLFACYLAVVGCLGGAERFLRLMNRSAAPAPSPGRSATLWGVLLVALLLGVGLPRAVQRLHANRGGNRAAGAWLAEHVNVAGGDVVEDDHAWSHFYAGLVFQEDNEPVLPPDVRPTCYTVITRSREERVDAERRKKEDELKRADGRVVYAWPDVSDAESARVVVYATPRDPKTHPWRTAP